MKTAELIAVGSELLRSGRTETNSLFLADLLGALGIEVRFKTIVGDVLKDIGEVLSLAVRRANIVIVTGGLGPTVDDVTRQAVAKVTGFSLKRNREAHHMMMALFASRQRIPTPLQHRQTLLPLGSHVIPNPVGTAPGFFFKWKGTLILCLPGVPSEARAMCEETIAPLLAATVKTPRRLVRRIFQVFGLTESEVDERIRSLRSTAQKVEVGIFASPLGVTVSLSRWVRNKNLSQGNKKNSGNINHPPDLVELAGQVRKVLGPRVFSEDNQGMEEVVGQLLMAKGFMVSLAESCTGGLIGHRLTQVPGSSTYLERGVVCYSNRSKMELLGVSSRVLRIYGAVSPEVALAMARGIHRQSGAKIGLSVTGIAGPGGATNKKPVGLVYVGLAAHRTAIARKFLFYGDRETIKLRASQGALDVLRTWLLTSSCDKGK